MMAVRSPLISPSMTNGLFSPFAERLDSPRPGFAPNSGAHMTSMTDKNSHLVPPSPNDNGIVDITDPSPVASSSGGTDFTDVDETPQERDSLPARIQSLEQIKSPTQPDLKIETKPSKETPQRSRSDDDENPPQSVIHAPVGFGKFKTQQNTSITQKRGNAANRLSQSQLSDRSRPSAAERPDSQASDRHSLPETGAESIDSRTSEITAVKTPLDAKHRVVEKVPQTPVSPPQLTTALAPVKDWSERATPRAQTRQEVEAYERRAPSRNSQLADIPEGQDVEGAETGPNSPTLSFAIGQFQDTEEELKALRSALAECWILCNTLASLSTIHRDRMFHSAPKHNKQEHAWKTCWKLCQRLYYHIEHETTESVRPTLELCRDFCQALFEVRTRDNEAADSVLRVSFELNNHLFNTHDHTLPDTVRERTLLFYITLCHRLMKQNDNLAEETDSLLRACWSLAEMLFTIRQTKREGNRPDEELLGSAIQACWELCDLFREGWTQVRPDRGTPRPSQTTFTQAFQQAKRSGFVPNDEPVPQSGFPETPTTLFEDMVQVSPEEAPVPNILVFGQNTPANNASRSANPANNPSSATYPQSANSATIPKWSANTSALSSSRPSSRASTLSAPHSAVSATSSTHTVTTPSEDPNLTLLKLLFVKAALNAGFVRPHSSPSSTSHPITLPKFVSALPEGAFGSQSWQLSLLENYKKVVGGDPAFRNIGPPVRAQAGEVAKAVKQMVQSGYFTWLRDLFRLVFGFYIEDAEQASRRSISVQT